MTHTFLLEIGLEDLPAQMIVPAEEQLKEKVIRFLKDKRLSYDTIITYSTPRRLALHIFGLGERQADEELSVRGPSLKIAQNPETGEWTKAGMGFAKGQGATVDDLIIKDYDGQPYIFIEKQVTGEFASRVLSELSAVIAEIEFPKNMKWGTHNYQYIRPIHWLVSLLDDQVIPFSVFGIQTGRQTEGHRFFGEMREIAHADDYTEVLAQELVAADRQERQAMIEEQILSLCAEKDWQSPLAYTDLLNEVTDLVEYPTVFYAGFDSDFLMLPDIVLQTSMISHQRYFPIRNQAGELLPYFIGVRNGTDQNIAEIAQGNEKVLAARLADAKFFYEEDQATPLTDWLEKLEHVDFHAQLGTLADKQRRVTQMAKSLSSLFALTDEETEAFLRASAIYKFDLVTAMVTEFPELQGTMGAIYATERGEGSLVAEAIGEQYLPESPEDDLPTSRVGKLLSLADKLDTLIHFFAIGLQPTGSNDPFALRRQANGIVRIIFALDQPISFRQLVRKLLESLDNNDFINDFQDELDTFHAFFAERVSQLMDQNDQIPHDIRRAVLGAKRDDFTAIIKMAQIIKEEAKQDSFKGTVESINRVLNLAEKAENEMIHFALFQTQSESELYSHILRVQSVYDKTLDPLPRFKALASLKGSIDRFFEDNMVMVDDDQLRENRLALLKRIANYANELADFRQLVY